MKLIEIKFLICSVVFIEYVKCLQIKLKMYV